MENELPGPSQEVDSPACVIGGAFNNYRPGERQTNFHPTPGAPQEQAMPGKQQTDTTETHNLLPAFSKIPFVAVQGPSLTKSISLDPQILTAGG